MIKCGLCKQTISKYEKDFESCGGIQIVIKAIPPEIVDICQNCSKKIALELIEKI